MLEGISLGLDIQTFMLVLVIILALGAVVTLILGLGGIRDSRQMKYYRLRRSRLVAGWRMLGISVLLAAVALVVNRFGEPAVYSVYTVSPTPPPSATASLIPTITKTPTITFTPTITPTASVSPSPTPIRIFLPRTTNPPAEGSAGG